MASQEKPPNYWKLLELRKELSPDLQVRYHIESI